MKEHYDAIIIGSGIAGMTAAIYLKRGGLNPLIIEENAPGGQLNKINTIANIVYSAKCDGSGKKPTPLIPSYCNVCNNWELYVAP